MKKDKKAILDRIRSTDWSFPGTGLFTGVHNFHWYPGRFIPQIPANLIDILTEPNDYILDPFCGTGTSLVEALRLGRYSIGVDSHPLAVLISSTETAPLTRDQIKEHIDRFGLKLEERIRHYSRSGVPNKLNSESQLVRELSVPEILIEDNWYHPKTLFELACLKYTIDEISVEFIDQRSRFKDLCSVAFSAILKHCSSQRNHYSYVADNMVPKDSDLKYEPAIQQFWKRLEQMILTLDQLAFELSQVFERYPVESDSVNVVQGDARCLDFIDNETIDAVITSPPYQGTLDTSTSHRLSAYWFGWDLPDLKRAEIGARWKRKRGSAFEEYAADMKKAYSEIHRVLRSGGKLAVVLGRSYSRERQSKVISLTQDILMGSLGFTEISDPIEREVSPTRRAVKSIHEEIILVLSKSS